MSERDIISKTEIPVTINKIVEELKRIGIKKGDTLLVHSSLSSLGWVCGGPQSVIIALKEVLGEEGTLVMPAHSGDWSDPASWNNPPVPKEWMDIIYKNLPAFDIKKTPTRGMGKIAELFRTFPNTLRSNHPQVSFCANGKFAQKIIKDHSLTPQFGMDTPLGKLYEMDAKVLLMGVGFDSCTSFHLSEALADGISKEKLGTAIFENGKRVWKEFYDYEYDDDRFELIGEKFEKTGKVTIKKVGDAKSKLFDMKTGVDFAKKWMMKNTK